MGVRPGWKAHDLIGTFGKYTDPIRRVRRGVISRKILGGQNFPKIAPPPTIKKKSQIAPPI